MIEYSSLHKNQKQKHGDSKYQQDFSQKKILHTDKE